MTASKSMPSPAQISASANTTTTETQSEQIDRLANEMRTKSGGELPLSFCIEQVQRQLSGKNTDDNGTAARATLPSRPTEQKGSVFHSWALGE